MREMRTSADVDPSLQKKKPEKFFLTCKICVEKKSDLQNLIIPGATPLCGFLKTWSVQSLPCYS